MNAMLEMFDLSELDGSAECHSSPGSAAGIMPYVLPAARTINPSGLADVLATFQRGRVKALDC